MGLNKTMWIIKDWAGNKPFPDKKFKTFQDAWEFIYGKFPDEEDWQEFYVVEDE